MAREMSRASETQGEEEERHGALWPSYDAGEWSDGGVCFQSKRRFLMLAGAGAASLFIARSDLGAAVRDPTKEEILEHLRRRIDASYPDDGTPEIGSKYLDRKALDGVNNRHERHKGIDIIQPYGTPVVAAASGLAQNNHTSKAGTKVRIIHDTGYYLNDVGNGNIGYSIPLVMATVYAHLSESAVPEQVKGDRWVHVERGDVIGAVGNSGTGAVGQKPHLHFGLYTLGPNKSWIENWEHINPHLLWAKGSGKVTRYDPNEDYTPSLRGLKLTFPLAPLPREG